MVGRKQGNFNDTEFLSSFLATPCGMQDLSSLTRD